MKEPLSQEVGFQEVVRLVLGQAWLEVNKEREEYM